MGELEISVYTGGLIQTPPIDVNVADDGSGMLRGTIAFVIHNTGTDAVTVTFDVLPDEGTPASWFRVETDQFTVPADAYVQAGVQITMPAEGGYERHHLRGRVRSPGLAPAVSEQGRFSRPLPPGWRLSSSPDTYLDLSYGGSEISFSFHGPSAGERLLFDIGAPDAESAGWFSVDQTVKGPFGLEPWDGTFTWRVNVNAGALIASGRPGVWLQPRVDIEYFPPISDGDTSIPGPEWKPCGYWFGYGVEVGG
ncbi:hypothetical protein [Spirillospora sp. CA-128828]|uniref:hypothetical protein n=1 Tax=Spirillospora sp. CA-128828 TaxID=3240033 RepID=UPI003D94D649